jgi:hypothetical protein
MEKQLKHVSLFVSIKFLQQRVRTYNFIIARAWVANKVSMIEWIITELNITVPQRYWKTKI